MWQTPDHGSYRLGRNSDYILDKEWTEVVNELHVRRKAETGNNFSLKKGTNDPIPGKNILISSPLKADVKL